MKFTVSSLALMAGAALAAPLEVASKADSLYLSMRQSGYSDGDILNFALTLEHLEDTFYKQGLANYTQADFLKFGSTPRFRQNVGEISADESTHVSFLTSALKAAGVQPVMACNYDFGVSDVAGFVGLASVLEGVGVAAYLGAASAIASKAYLTAAGAILTVEARHNAYWRDGQMPPQSPFPAPFDTPLDPNQVFTLASQFITGCPSGNPTLPFTAFPPLALGPTSNGRTPFKTGDIVPLVSNIQISKKGQLYCAWPDVAGTHYTVAKIGPKGMGASCAVPAGIAGQTYAILTTSSNALSDSNTVAGPAIVPVQSTYTYGGFTM